jgi:glutamate-1-semialdehyde 2,1-aminomutase
VDDVTFDISEGKTLGVVGESGCGKSTLGLVVLGLSDATSGQILFEGRDITYADKRLRHELRKEMQIIFQDPFSSLNPRMTVEEIIGEPLQVYKVCKTRAEWKRRVGEIMETVGLAERLTFSYPHELDGGRRQRIGIGRALAMNPKFIVCDEPVSALDVSIQAQVLNLMMDLQEQMGLTYIFITHDLSVVKHISEVGTVFALASELDGIVARKITESVESMERVRLNNSGTEAVIYALRLAKAYTGRAKVIRFEGMYHGYSDSIYWSKHPSDKAIAPDGSLIAEAQGPGVSACLGDDLIILNWNDADELKRTIEKNASDIAAVITEPIMCNTGCVLPEKGYLETMRELCVKFGIVLIFDEVITGFRIGLGGAQGKFGVKPDLSIFAKGMGGGFPVASVGGRKEIMDLVDTGKISIAGTYSGNGIALSAVNATLDVLRQPGFYGDLYAKSEKLQTGLNDLFKKSKLDAYVVGMGPLFQVWFAKEPIKNYRDAKKYANGDIFTLWWEEMLFRGVLFHPHYFENLFVSTAHTNADIDSTLQKAEESIAALEKKIRA